MNLRFLTYLGLGIAFWLSFLIMAAEFQWDLSYYQALHELIAIPILLGSPVVFILLLISYRKSAAKPILSLVSLIFLALSLLFITWSFFS